MNGHYFDLNQTTLAYRLGGKDTYWVDYTINDNWWDSLSEEERETISNLIK